MEKKSSFFASARALLADKEKCTYALLFLRYLFPFVIALTVGILGSFYNIQRGRLRLSLWQLWFNTVKQGREALVLRDAVGAARSYYILLLVGAAVALLALIAALVLALIALYTFLLATGKRGADERREAKILFRAVFHSRVSLFLSNLLLLLPSLFPLYFTVVSNRHTGGGFIPFGFDPVLTVSLCLVFLLAFFCLYLVKRERGTPFDMFYIEPERAVGDADADEDHADEADADGDEVEGTDYAE